MRRIAVLRAIRVSSRANRLLHAGFAASVAALLVLCAAVQPDPRGFGTHQRFGLPECLVCKVTGWKQCPSCGLTTACCHLVRGRLDDARKCHRGSPYVMAMLLTMGGYCAVVAILDKRWLEYELLGLALGGPALLAYWVLAAVRG